MPHTVSVPAPVNAHSHAFHRVLRGRTHHGGGDFWVWREQMYSAAAQLTPDAYQQLATAVYAEMVCAGYSAVGEFHYLHHQPDGTPYPDHDMERALARAAKSVGIRLVLLDTLYLQGGLDASGETIELNLLQRRFSDGDAQNWASRWESLREAIAEEDSDAGTVTLGAAVHSLRAVPADQLPVVTELIRKYPGAPVHIHLSEQPAENDAVQAAYRRTPTEVLAEAGVLGTRLSAVHATHLTASDIQLLGQSGTAVVMCPTTEADLADGIGPARQLAAAGAEIALGSDQHAVIDPYLEMRALEHGERLSSGARGRFSPQQIAYAAREGGLRSLGMSENDDVITVDSGSSRTSGSRPEQLPLTATSADVVQVSIAGTVQAHHAAHTSLGDPAELYRTFFTDHPEYA
ncbi:formimidoylglutamate deiminase [Nesterenkonia muleiensis]|uniref:formimidoylglutamate deiminase n=1 Tax=Nesterenkonia muleiensis TaxID=2282648 RepID=UPI000E75183D|nr:formimidoylglutamate deiminase [Nesterenkonia muleiensis]